MEVIKVVLLALVIMGLVVAGLAVQMLLKKGGKFRDTHIGSNRYLKSKVVANAQTGDRMEQAKAWKENRFYNNSPDHKKS